MIRTSIATSFSHRLNSFHSQSSVTSGFSIPVGTSVPPVPPAGGFIGTDKAEAPFLRVGATLYVSPTGKLSVGGRFSEAYITFRSSSGPPFDFVYSDGYSGFCNYVFPNSASNPDLVASGEFPYPTVQGELSYIRFDERSVGSYPLRFFTVLKESPRLRCDVFAVPSNLSSYLSSSGLEYTFSAPSVPLRGVTVEVVVNFAPGQGSVPSTYTLQASRQEQYTLSFQGAIELSPGQGRGFEDFRMICVASY